MRGREDRRWSRWKPTSPALVVLKTVGTVDLLVLDERLGRGVGQPVGGQEVRVDSGSNKSLVNEVLDVLDGSQKVVDVGVLGGLVHRSNGTGVRDVLGLVLGQVDLPGGGLVVEVRGSLVFDKGDDGSLGGLGLGNGGRGDAGVVVREGLVDGVGLGFLVEEDREVLDVVAAGNVVSERGRPAENASKDGSVCLFGWFSRVSERIQGIKSRITRIKE